MNLFPLRHLYCSLVRPYLDYAISVWNPYHTKDIKLIEAVQRKVAKLVKELKNLFSEERFKILELTPLDQRRDSGDLIQVYKIINKLKDVNLLKIVFRWVQLIQTVGLLKMKGTHFFACIKSIGYNHQSKHIEKTACLSFLTNRRFESIEH